MPKSNKSFPPERMEQSTVREYYTVVPKPLKEKNQKKALESEE